MSTRTARRRTPLIVAAVPILTLGVGIAGCSTVPGPETSATPGDSTEVDFDTAELVYTDRGRVRISAFDGSGSAEVSATPTREQLHPDWSPEGDAIVFAADDDGTRDIWVARAGDAERIVDCTDPCAFTDDPAWSHDGTAIAFHRGVAGADDVGIATLETVAPDGSAGAVIATLPTAEYPFAPRWSPDDTQIVTEIVTFFTADIAEEAIASTRIAIASVADGSITEIEGAPVGAGSPDWNPDGTRILYTAPDAAVRSYSDLWWISPGGGSPTRITDVAKDSTRALLGTWSPDGRSVIFDHETRLGDPSSAMISTVPADGGEIAPGFPGTHPRLRP